MNIESTLSIKVRTIRRMEEELARDELVESEIADLNEIVDEMKTQTAEYLMDLGGEEVVRRLGADHWMITGDDIDDDVMQILDGLDKLLKG